MGTASPPAHIVVVRTCVRVEKVLFNSFVRKYGALSFFAYLAVWEGCGREN